MRFTCSKKRLFDYYNLVIDISFSLSQCDHIKRQYCVFNFDVKQQAKLHGCSLPSSFNPFLPDWRWPVTRRLHFISPQASRRIFWFTACCIEDLMNSCFICLHEENQPKKDRKEFNPHFHYISWFWNLANF